MGFMLLIIAACMIAVAGFLGPKLYVLGIKRGARWSFQIVMIATGAYLFWISTLFFADRLGNENYVWELWLLRIGLLCAIVHFLVAVIRCKV